LATVPHLPAGTLADVGSGAGLPGIPIAIAEPDRPVTLAESNHKKAAFLRQAKIELRLTNAQVHLGRVEDWDPVEKFAVVISRGFAEISAFFEACRHLVCAGGVLVAMKGPLAREELQRAGAALGQSRVVQLHVPKLGAERNLVICQLGA